MLSLSFRVRPAAAGPRHARRVAPSCRGGVSSLLRLAQPAAPRLPSTLDLGDWVSRAAGVLKFPVAAAFAPSEFNAS